MFLKTNSGEKKQVDIIATFKIERYDGDYVIYKLDNEYYGAKYKNKDNSSELITDLSDEEKKIINEFYIKFQKEGVIND